ncbi:hypothetical protein JMJ99_08755 [Companilactobacillus zhachilii]|jgi:hypothetical protein|uniref:hypothetical protein n=1 Tax=Companilactobacillus zhachilii TaxID=2304606 RepID=UPI001920A501|nr:hypothetical protein [Companilactobacillus zhachilii]MBL3531455.1 hypothetical protein [Companilactobacillus zhachilii]
MEIGNEYYPLGQYVIFICFVIILYLNLRKHGWGMKYNQLLTYLVLIIGTILTHGKDILNSQDWFGIISPFIIAFMYYNKRLQKFRADFNNYLDKK